MNRILANAAAVVMLGSASAAHAAVEVYTSPGDVQPAENVLLNSPQTGQSVTGMTNQTGTAVTFLSNETITSPSNGQARVEATDGSLNQLSFYLSDPSRIFTQFEFNAFNALPGTTSIFLSLNGGGVMEFMIGNGQNFFGASATGGDYFTNVAFDTNGAGVLDVRQIRLGGIGAIPPTSAVPEPATWALFLLGFFAVGSAMRRRKKEIGSAGGNLRIA